ncbi:hypothetical protein D9M68_972010 [compost metagenome]
MHNAKAIDHFSPYIHFDAAVPFFYFQYTNTQPLAEKIMLHHMIDYLRRTIHDLKIWGFENLKMRGAMC